MWSSLVARLAHNQKVVGSNPTIATEAPGGPGRGSRQCSLARVGKRGSRLDREPGASSVWAGSSVWSEQRPYTATVGSSTLSRPTLDNRVLSDTVYGMTTLTGRRGKIQSAWLEWREPESSHFLADAIYAAILEGEDDFDGLRQAVDRGLFEFAETPGQDLVEVVYYSIERAQRTSEAPPWTPPVPDPSRSLFTSNSGL